MSLPIVHPQPTPVSVSIEVVEAPQGKIIAFAVYHVTGASVFFFPPENAEAIVKALRDKIREAKVGLVLPNKQMTDNIHDLMKRMPNGRIHGK